jgi:hypothetical protein
MGIKQWLFIIIIIIIIIIINVTAILNLLFPYFVWLFLLHYNCIWLARDVPGVLKGTYADLHVYNSYVRNVLNLLLFVLL